MKFVEIFFKRENFKHLTGVSFNGSAALFYDKCIGRRGKRIEWSEIYTTTEHPFNLAKKKLTIFMDMYKIFSCPSYILETIITEQKQYKFAIADISLTLLCEQYDKNRYLTATSLRKGSFLTRSNDFHSIDYVFVSNNSKFGFENIVYKNQNCKYNEEELKIILNKH